MLNNQQAWLAPAKINLFLRITSRRDDGMHELETAFQFIDMCDEIKFSLRDDEKILRVSESIIQSQQDLTVRAAKALQSHNNNTQARGVDIEIIKRIPMGGGLGGASSDAATALIILNQLWQLFLSIDELAAIGCQLGADVPIFIYGHSAWATGIGEQLTPILIDEHWYLVVNPQVHVSTAEMFADSQLTRNSPKLTICPPKVGQYQNVFEPVVRSKYPKIDSVFNWLSEYSDPFLTGTGGCVVAAFADKKSALEIQSRCPEDVQAYVVKGLNTSPLHAQLEAALN